jgi:hypothetical protein
MDDIMSPLNVETVQRDVSIVRATTSRDIVRIGTAGIVGESLADGLERNTELEVRCITGSGERYDAPQRFGGGFSCSIGAWGTLTCTSRRSGSGVGIRLG